MSKTGTIVVVGSLSAIGIYALTRLFNTSTTADAINLHIEKFDLKKDAMALKNRVAYIIVAGLHSEKKAKLAEGSFTSTFQKGEIPEKMTELDGKGGKPLMDILVEAKVLSSKGEFRRLIEEKAVTNLDADKKITDVNFVPQKGMKFKVGKKTFIKII